MGQCLSIPGQLNICCKHSRVWRDCSALFSTALMSQVRWGCPTMSSMKPFNPPTEDITALRPPSSRSQTTSLSLQTHLIAADSSSWTSQLPPAPSSSTTTPATLASPVLLSPGFSHSSPAGHSFITINGSSSPCAPINQGVPQSSVLGPLLFTIYMLPLATQLYLSTTPSTQPPQEIKS